MKNRNKMQRTNQKVRKWLIENKYKDITFFPHTRFSKDLHLLNLSFDGACSDNQGRIYFFQCKSNCKPTKKQQEDMKMFYVVSKCQAFWFNKPDRKPLEVY